MRETTRIHPGPTPEQEAAGDFVAEAYGRSYVRRSRLGYATGCAVVTGLTEDIVRSCWIVRPDGTVAAALCRDRALRRYLASQSPARLPNQIGPERFTGLDAPVA